jgi:hypothetical protein
LELQEIRTIYRNTDRLTMLLLIVSLPAFAMVYLYQSSGKVDWNLPPFSESMEWALAGVSAIVMIIHYILFHREINVARGQADLVEKVRIYCKATRQRFWILFLVSLLATAGLLLSENPIFTLIFALTMVFFSLGKPSPDRMARLMRLKKEDRELIRQASRPESD